jgi:hypothetical protein
MNDRVTLSYTRIRVAAWAADTGALHSTWLFTMTHEPLHKVPS